MRGYNEYIGARYVPKFDGDWDNTKEYEPLIIVSYQGNSYTSKTFVPKNVDINDTTYWALTGNYNAQVEAYRQEVAHYVDEVNSIDGSITHEFMSLRIYENLEHKIGQVALKLGNNLISVVHGVESFNLYVFDQTYTLIGTYTYNYSIHANAIFKHNNKICVINLC